MTAGMLARRMIDRKVPRSEQWRYDPGRGISMDTIAGALMAANNGVMPDWTDLGGVTIDADPNLASCLDRRLGMLDSAPYTVRPAKGYGIDRAKAKAIADELSRELRLLPSPTNWGEFLPKKRSGLGPLISALNWAIWDGRASVEKVWAPVAPSSTRKVRWTIGELVWIHPRRLSFGPRRELRIVEAFQRVGNFAEVGIDLTEIPNKYINYLPQLFREYPEREGYQRRACYWSFFKRVGTREQLVLSELFGHPYKIVEVENDAKATATELEQLDDDVENLGASEQLRLPKGVKLELPWPHPESGGIHDNIVDRADRQIQILLLGQTMTTSDGSSRAQAEVHERQQNIYPKKDAARMSACLDSDLIHPLVALNAAPFGLESDDAIDAYCPTIEIHAESQPDRNAEVERLGLVLDRGIPIAVEEVYEIAGFRTPEEGEEVVVATSATAKIFANVEEAKAQQAAAPPMPPGMPGAPGAMPFGAGPPDPGAPPDPTGTTPEQAPTAPADQSAPPAEEDRSEMPRAMSRTLSFEPHHADPRDQIASIYQRRARPIVSSWARLILEAIGSGGATSWGIQAALDALELDTKPLSDLLEESAIRSAMVAAMDVAHATGHTRLTMGDPTHAMDFVRAPFSKALEAFMRKEPIPRPLFDTLSQNARRTAFTMAGAVSSDMLELVHQELADAIATGASLARFKSKIAAAFEEQGWTTPAPAHLETVFRTNTMGAYGEARFQAMTTPAAAEKRPYLMWVATKDDRTRDSHAAAHGKIMRADDATWDRVRPPAGFNCRCELRSLRLEDAKRRDGQDTNANVEGLPDKYEIVDGSDPVWDDLPDPGFAARMFRIPWAPVLLADSPAGKPPFGKKPKPEDEPAETPEGDGSDEETEEPQGATGEPDEADPNMPEAIEPVEGEANQEPEESEAEEAPEHGAVIDGEMTDEELEMLAAFVVDREWTRLQEDEETSLEGYLEIAADGTVHGARLEVCDPDEEEDEAEGEVDPEEPGEDEAGEPDGEEEPEEGAEEPDAEAAQAEDELDKPRKKLSMALTVRRLAGEYDESKHPRAEDGKWSAGGGGGGGSSKDEKSPKGSGGAAPKGARAGKATHEEAVAGLIHQIRENTGGFTWNADVGVPTSGVMVAYHPSEKRGFKLEVGKDHDPAAIDREVAKLVDSQLDFVNEDPEHRFFGGWANVVDGEIEGVYVEVSRLFPIEQEAEALRVAEQNDQIAAFRLDDFTELKTGGTGKGLDTPTSRDDDRGKNG